MRIAIAILTLWAAVAVAQWPSWSTPMQSFDRGNQALSGAVERLNVAVDDYEWYWYADETTFGAYFAQRRKCKAVKDMLYDAIAAGTWVYPFSGGLDNAEYVTHSNILSRVGLPTNWWDVTPFFNLSAHTNGWRFVPAVMSNLCWGVYDAPYMNATHYAGPVLFGTSTNSFLEAYSNATYQFDGNQSGDGWRYTATYPNANDYRVTLRPMTGTSTQVYINTTNLLEAEVLYFGSGLGLTNALATNATGVFEWYGPLNSPMVWHGVYPQYPGEVVTNTEDRFWMDKAVIKWNATTNGFKWFR